MPREEKNILQYTIALISEFANKFGLGGRQAYNYLNRFQGLAYLTAYYDVLHTLSFEESIEAISAECNQHGGLLQYQHP